MQILLGAMGVNFGHFLFTFESVKVKGEIAIQLINPLVNRLRDLADIMHVYFT